MNQVVAVSLVALAATSPLAAVAQTTHETAAVSRGREVALDICAICHVVAPNQKDAPVLRQPTPSFEDIANRPNTTYGSLRHFVATTHWDHNTTPMTMDNFVLPDHEMDDIILYILSLRKHPPVPGADKAPQAP